MQVIRIDFNFSVVITYNFTFMFSLEFFTLLLFNPIFIERQGHFILIVLLTDTLSFSNLVPWVSTSEQNWVLRHNYVFWKSALIIKILIENKLLQFTAWCTGFVVQYILMLKQQLKLHNPASRPTNENDNHIPSCIFQAACYTWDKLVNSSWPVMFLKLLDAVLWITIIAFTF